VACEKIDHPNIMPGWGCCKCRVYNGMQRIECKNCGHVSCIPLDVEDLTEYMSMNFHGIIESGRN
jgi:hypothetical protein